MENLVYVDEYGILGKNSYWQMRDKIKVSKDQLAEVDLTDDSVQLTSLVFRNLSYPDSSGPLRVELAVNSKNISGLKEYNSSFSLNSTASLLKSSPSSPLSYCWGIGGVCDSSCQYNSFGAETDFYNNPGCSASCSSAGKFYIGPSGGCSDIGIGSCYKVSDPVNLSTACAKGISCQNCWSIGEACDSECSYRLFGTARNYYDNPGCAGACSITGTFYTGPDLQLILLGWEKESWAWMRQAEGHVWEACSLQEH